MPIVSSELFWECCASRRNDFVECSYVTTPYPKNRAHTRRTHASAQNQKRHGIAMKRTIMALIMCPKPTLHTSTQCHQLALRQITTDTDYSTTSPFTHQKQAIYTSTVCEALVSPEPAALSLRTPLGIAHQEAH